MLTKTIVRFTLAGNVNRERRALFEVILRRRCGSVHPGTMRPGLERQFWLFALVLAPGGLGACSFTAQATGAVDSGAGAHAEANAETASKVETEPTPTPVPVATPPIQLKQGRLEYRGVINFEYDRAELRDDSETTRTLSEFDKFLQEHPQVSLEIEGHTDSRGSDEYNLDLSQRRATSVKDWLTDHGIDTGRLSAVGKGEADPQRPEPEACRNADQENLPACEEIWAENRRVVFEVTRGEETIAEPPPPPPPPPPPKPEPVAAPAPPVSDCPWLFGGHLGALGPRSLVTVAAVAQPGVCWLEVGLGMGYGAGRYSASAVDLTAHGHYSSFTIPLRATVWFMERGHSLVADVGLGVTHFRMKATAANVYEGRYEYTRNTTPFLSTLALGYGWRPEGPQPGYRFTALLGGVFYPTTMGASNSGSEGAFAPAAADQLTNALDDRTEDFTDAGVFLEAQLGLLF